MFVFQILATLFILFALSRILGRVRTGALPGRESIGWVVFWVLLGVAVWFPEIPDRAARALGISRGVDLIVAGAIALFFYLVFRIFVRLEKMERDISKIVEQHALKEGDRDRRV